MKYFQSISLCFKKQIEQFKLGYIQLLEVDNIQKSKVVSGVLIFFHAFFYLSILANTEFELFNQKLIPNILLCFQIFIVISISLFIASYFIQANRRSEFYFPIVCVGFYAGSLMMVGYIAGMMTILTGVFTIGSILAGLLLFERRIMFYSTLPCLIVLYVTSILTVIHVLPYAPLYHPYSMIVEETQSYFLLVNLFATTFIGTILVVLFNSFLDRWMDRERKQRHLMTIDPLTQILNRRGIATQLERIYTTNSNLDQPISISLIDIDFFKKINDQYGHDCGDQVLVHIAKLLRLNIRENDHLGRYGGEEFIVVFENTNLTTAQNILERCRKAIEQHELAYDGQIIRFTASFGLAHATLENSDQQRLILATDQALYRAKETGRNKICISD